MSLELLTRPSLWMETNVSTVAAAMTENGVRTLRLGVGKSDRALFAMVLIRGEDTQVMLDALDKAERDLGKEKSERSGVGFMEIPISVRTPEKYGTREKPQ